MYDTALTHTYCVCPGTSLMVPLLVRSAAPEPLLPMVEPLLFAEVGRMLYALIGC